MKGSAAKAAESVAGEVSNILVGLRIVVMGAPGAGKGTQAIRLAESQGIPHISTGDIFRTHMELGTELGEEVKHYIDEGHLAPDDLACKIVAHRLSKPDCANGYILDGFPRSLAQADCLSRMMTERDEGLDYVFNITVEDEEIVERLTARRMCPLCGAIYNLRFEPPKVAGQCDNPECKGAQLVQRPDDEEETVRERLRIYHSVSEPILGFYDSFSTLHNVPGMAMTPDQVFATIEEVIRSTEAQSSASAKSGAP